MFKALFSIAVLITFLNANILDSAFKKAKAQKKLILVEISKQNCPYCEALEREVFQNPNYLKEIEKNYIIIKLQKNRDKIPSFLKTRFYPTTYILKYDKTIIDELPGYMKSDNFIDFIKEVYRQERKFL